jgi:hypothetical protein
MSFRRGPLFRRGRAGQRHAAFAAASLEPPRPFGPALDNLDIKSLLIEEDAPKIENVTYVASYNWLDGAHPVILVPGKSSFVLHIIPQHLTISVNVLLAPWKVTDKYSHFLRRLGHHLVRIRS